MSSHADPHESPVTDYAAAMAQERAEWEIASNARLGAVQRVIAYARWLSATERTKALSPDADRTDPQASLQ